MEPSLVLPQQSLSALHVSVDCSNAFDKDLNRVLGYLVIKPNLAEALGSYMPCLHGLSLAEPDELPNSIAKTDGITHILGPAITLCSLSFGQWNLS